MTQYAIVDIGSNTIVLVIYEIQQGKPVQTYYQSTSAHLIDTVDEQGTMSKDGIAKAYAILTAYEKICDEKSIQYRWADITEPCRIVNQSALVDKLSMTSFTIYPLSGYEEAACDYYGTKYSYPSMQDGIAFDVGGGSTELISFQDGQILDAVSFHLGCVRLAHLPLDTTECAQQINQQQTQYPSLATSAKQIIGIGGTMRAVGLTCDALYQTGMTLPVHLLKELYDNLCQKEPSAIEAMQRCVDISRQPVFLPGIHMILEICTAFDTDTILISSTGIREGFLQMCIAKNKVVE